LNRATPVFIPILLLVLAFSISSCGGARTSRVAASSTPTADAAIAMAAPMSETVAVTITAANPGNSADAAANGGRARCPQATRAQMDEIALGALAPVSIPGAYVAGGAMQTAFNLATEEINASGGILDKPVRLVFEDTAGDPDVGIQGAQRLIVEECVVGLVGVYHSRVALAVKDVAHQYGVPIIFAEPYNEAVTADMYPEVFRVAPAFAMVIDSDVAWLAAVGDYNQDGMASVVFITEQEDAGVGRVEAVVARLADRDIAAEILAIDLTSDMYTSVIARIAALDHIPDVVSIQLPHSSGLSFQRQLNEAGFGPRRGTLILTHQSALDSDAFWREVPEGNYTVIDKIGPWTSTVTEQGQAFAAAYAQINQRWPESYAFGAYDALHLLADAIERAGSVAADEIIASLERTDVELASGRYYFPYGTQNPPDGKVVPAYMWHQWPAPQLLRLQYTENNQDAAETSVLWPETYRTVDVPVVPAPLP